MKETIFSPLTGATSSLGRKPAQAIIIAPSEILPQAMKHLRTKYGFDSFDALTVPGGIHGARISAPQAMPFYMDRLRFLQKAHKWINVYLFGAPEVSGMSHTEQNALAATNTMLKNCLPDVEIDVLRTTISDTNMNGRRQSLMEFYHLEGNTQHDGSVMCSGVAPETIVVGCSACDACQDASDFFTRKLGDAAIMALPGSIFWLADAVLAEDRQRLTSLMQNYRRVILTTHDGCAQYAAVYPASDISRMMALDHAAATSHIRHGRPGIECISMHATGDKNMGITKFDLIGPR